MAQITTPAPVSASALLLAVRNPWASAWAMRTVTHTGWTVDGRAVEVCLHVMPAHQWHLEYEWPADQQPS